MAGNYLIVHKKILPDYLEKVIEARELLKADETMTVTDAVRKAGISRNTFYKYRDYVFRMQESSESRRASISVNLKDRPGSLSEMIRCLSGVNASIITISQSVPVDRKAAVVMTISTSGMEGTVEDLLEMLKQLPDVSSVRLNSMD
ncbi:MAG: ACT domain-containing protein [Solobacterium sp.]|nr:ACT domain-containing protein [Solobacterium sp.]